MQSTIPAMAASDRADGGALGIQHRTFGAMELEASGIERQAAKVQQAGESLVPIRQRLVFQVEYAIGGFAGTLGDAIPLFVVTSNQCGSTGKPASRKRLRKWSSLSP